MLDAYPELKEESERYSTMLIMRHVDLELFRCSGQACQETLEQLSRFTLNLKDQCQVAEVSKCQYLPYLQLVEHKMIIKVKASLEAGGIDEY